MSSPLQLIALSSKRVTLVFPIAYAVLHPFFAQKCKSSCLYSNVCTLFAKTTAGYPNDSQFGNPLGHLIPGARYLKFSGLTPLAGRLFLVSGVST